MSKDFNQELNIAKKAALEAGILLKNNKEDIKLRPDIEAEKIIKNIIKQDSCYGILGEEGVMSPDTTSINLWVIDPIDGTENFSRNIPMCSVSIALLSNFKPVLGVIYDFNNNELYEGSINKSACLNQKQISVSKTEKSQEGILLTGLPKNTDFSDEAMNELINNFQNWRKVRIIGSSALASAYVASGKADLYMEKKSYLWNIAAGAAIVNAAGGEAIIVNQNEKFQVDVSFSNSIVKA
jgi:myo-inositol-1(or 4)-monophosphatase